MKKYKSHKEVHIGDSLMTCYITRYLGLNGTINQKGPNGLLDINSSKRPGYMVWTKNGDKFIPIYRN